MADMVPPPSTHTHTFAQSVSTAKFHLTTKVYHVAKPKNIYSVAKHFYINSVLHNNIQSECTIKEKSSM